MASLKTQIENFSKAQKALAGGMIVVAGLFYFLGYRPQNEKLRDLNAQIEHTESDLSARQVQAQRLPEVVANLNRLRVQLSDFKKLPDHLETGEFLTELGQIARESNLPQTPEYSINGQAKPYDYFIELPVSLQLHGDFLNVFDFLRQVEDMKRLTRINSVTLHGADLRSGQVDVKAEVSLYFSEE